MHAFTDTAGRTWSLTINVAAIKRVRGLVNVDLLGLVDEGLKGLSALVGDPVQLADVLFALCQGEAAARQVSDEDFGQSLSGDVIATAADAFLEELIDFFPEAQVRANLKLVLSKSRQMGSKLIEFSTTTLEQIDPQAEAQKLIASWTNSPGSSASAPTPLPSASS